MDRDGLLDLITTEDVITLMKDLGTDYIKDRKGNLYFRTICHGGNKYKLLYFANNKFFQCLTECGTLSIYDLISEVKGIPFEESFRYLCKFKGVSATRNRRTGLKSTDIDLEEELNFLSDHLRPRKKTELYNLPEYDKNVLSIFDLEIPYSWKQEGITEEIGRIFGVGFYYIQGRAIIPHRDIEGKLIGIRGRSFLTEDLEAGRKYMPVTIQGLTYRYPTGLSLYGIYENQDNIRKRKKAIVFEGEKSVYKMGAFFGQNNNIALATMGMNFNTYHRDLLLSLGVEELTIAYDKQYLLEYITITEEQAKDPETLKKHKEYCKYIQNLMRIAKLVGNYMTISVILCWDDTLDYKDAPIDEGKEVFMELYNNRYVIEDYEDLEELLE